MKRTFVVCCAVALLSLMVAAQAKDKKMGSGTEQAVAGLEQQWTDAAKASNPEPLAPLLADKFVSTDIATGNWVGKGSDENGKPVDAHERWTDTWMKMSNGKWQCVASHASTIKM